MWFWLSLIALLCWSGSDLFSKIGCQSETDKYSHLKMVTAVGVVMGLHAAYEIFIGGTQVTWEIIWTYLPVSLLYISSMAMGYIGLRYIELSISSPICNSSGALVAVLCLITGGMGELVPAQLVATALVCVGVVGLGIVEAHEDEDLRRKRQEAANRRYAKSALALLLPIIYCILDAAGTFADSRVLDKLSARALAEGMFATADECSDYAASPQVCRRGLRDGGAVRLYLRPVRHGPCGHLRPHHLRLLRGVGGVEPDLPEGEAVPEALSHDRPGGGGYRHPGRVRRITQKKA